MCRDFRRVFRHAVDPKNKYLLCIIFFHVVVLVAWSMDCKGSSQKEELVTQNRSILDDVESTPDPIKRLGLRWLTLPSDEVYIANGQV